MLYTYTENGWARIASLRKDQTMLTNTKQTLSRLKHLTVTEFSSFMS